MVSLFLEDLELFLQNDINLGILIDNITIIILLFADDMVIFRKKQQKRKLGLLRTFCSYWSLGVNVVKTTVMVFRKRGRLFNDDVWT